MNPDMALPLSWKFHNPTDVRFGTGCVDAAAGQFAWKNMLLVTTPGMVSRGVASKVMEAWKEVCWSVTSEVTPNPRLADLDAWAKEWRGRGIEGIVALGGGSAVDAGKVLGVLLGAPADFSLARHFKEGAPLAGTPPVPMVAIPTTSGTGSEVTPFATVWDMENGKKYSLAGSAMFPKVALLDPELTLDLPWGVTVATGLDALCQAMESVWNRHASPVTLELALRAARGAWEVLREGREILTSLPLRSRLMEASLLAGLAISQTRTALCHSISYPVTAKLGVPHGVACGFVMPPVLRFNEAADDGRLARLALVLGFASAGALADGVEELLRGLGVPQMLAGHGVALSTLESLTGGMIAPGRADNNLRPAGVDDVRGMLREYLPGFLLQA